MSNSSLEAEIKKLLESSFWPVDLEAMELYSVQADDAEGIEGRDDVGIVSLIVGDNGDVAISVDNKGCTFRYHGQGGGEHRFVRNALVILAEAIRLENEGRR